MECVVVYNYTHMHYTGKWFLPCIISIAVLVLNSNVLMVLSLEAIHAMLIS